MQNKILTCQLYHKLHASSNKSFHPLVFHAEKWYNETNYKKCGLVMFKRFCKLFIASAFGLPLIAVCCMFLLWLFGILEVGFVQPVKSFILAAVQIIPFADTAISTANAACFSPGAYIELTANNFITEFLSAFFLGGVIYLIDGFLSKRRRKDSVTFFAKFLGLVVGSLILRFTNLMNELTAIITQYALVVIIIALILIVSRILFVGLKAFSVMGVAKTLLQTLLNAIVAVILGCYLGTLGCLAVANPVALSGSIVNVIVIFLISGFSIAISLVIDALMSNNLK